MLQAYLNPIAISTQILQQLQSDILEVDFCIVVISSRVITKSEDPSLGEVMWQEMFNPADVCARMCPGVGDRPT